MPLVQSVVQRLGFDQDPSVRAAALQAIVPVLAHIGGTAGAASLQSPLAMALTDDAHVVLNTALDSVHLWLPAIVPPLPGGPAAQLLPGHWHGAREGLLHPLLSLLGEHMHRSRVVLSWRRQLRVLVALRHVACMHPSPDVHALLLALLDRGLSVAATAGLQARAAHTLVWMARFAPCGQLRAGLEQTIHHLVVLSEEPRLRALLGEMAGAACWLHSRRAVSSAYVPALIDQLLDDAAPRVRRSAASALGCIGPWLAAGADDPAVGQALADVRAALHGGAQDEKQAVAAAARRAMDGMTKGGGGAHSGERRAAAASGDAAAASSSSLVTKSQATRGMEGLALVGFRSIPQGNAEAATSMSASQQAAKRAAAASELGLGGSQWSAFEGSPFADPVLGKGPPGVGPLGSPASSSRRGGGGGLKTLPPLALAEQAAARGGQPFLPSTSATAVAGAFRTSQPGGGGAPGQGLPPATAVYLAMGPRQGPTTPKGSTTKWGEQA